MNNKIYQVEARVIFLRIGDIDTINEKFFAEILIETRWKEPELIFKFDDSKLLNEEKELTDADKFWNPKIYVENIINDPKQTVHYQARKKCNFNATYSSEEIENQNEPTFWIYEYIKIKGFFFQKLKLKYFPLDVQDLSIKLTTLKSRDQVLLIQNQENSSIIGSSMTIDKNIWQLYQHVEVISTVDTISNEKLRKNELNNVFLNSPVLIFKCRVSRCAGYYFWNAFILIFLISAAVFAIFSVRPDQPHFRLPFTATLLLTSITFRWSYSSRCLPTVNYLTSIDIYSIESIVLIFFCLVWHGLVTIFFNFFEYNFVNLMDKIFLGLVFLLFILFHIILLIWLKSALNLRNLMEANDLIFLDNQNQFDNHAFSDIFEIFDLKNFRRKMSFSKTYNRAKNISLINFKNPNQINRISNINENNKKF